MEKVEVMVVEMEAAMAEVVTEGETVVGMVVEKVEAMVEVRVVA